MKICIISSLYFPYFVGGGEIVIKKISRELINRNHEIIILTAGPRDIIREENGIKIIEIDAGNIYHPYEFYKKTFLVKPLWHLIDLFNLNAYFKILRILRNENPDVVHVHNYKGLSPLLFKAAKKLNIPVAFTLHGYSPICPRGTLVRSSGTICESSNFICKAYNLIQTELIENNVDVLIAPSEFTLKTLHSNKIFTNTESFILRNPIEINKKRIKKNYDTFDILFVGALSENKGIHILVDAFKEISSEKFRLHIVGKGYLEKKLRGLAEIDKRIIFHGFKSGEVLKNLYENSNITVVPSLGLEVFGMTIIESFVNSTPVIASNIGGIPEIVKDNYNGFLFEPGDVDELRGLLDSLTEETLKYLEYNAFNSSKKYDVKDHVKNLEKIYGNIAEVVS